MKIKTIRPKINVNTELPKNLTPDDALKFKLAMATRLLKKKERSSLFVSVVKQQMKGDVK